MTSIVIKQNFKNIFVKISIQLKFNQNRSTKSVSSSTVKTTDIIPKRYLHHGDIKTNISFKNNIRNIRFHNFL